MEELVQWSSKAIAESVMHPWKALLKKTKIFIIEHYGEHRRHLRKRQIGNLGLVSFFAA